MDTQSFEEKVKDALSKGVKASKEALSKAGSAVQNFSDKSVNKIEKQQLINKQKVKFEEMGKKLSTLLKYEAADLQNLSETVNLAEENMALANDILALQKDILKLDKEIAQHDKEIQKLEEAAKADKTAGKKTKKK